MIRLLLGYIILGVLVVVGCAESENQKNLDPRTITTPPAIENRVPGQYIVTLKEGVGTELLQEVFAEFGIQSVKDLSSGRYLITLEKDPGPEVIIKQAATSSEIEHVQPNYIYRTMQPAQESPQRTR
jgi:hypothetical protein